MLSITHKLQLGPKNLVTHTSIEWNFPEEIVVNEYRAATLEYN